MAKIVIVDDNETDIDHLLTLLNLYAKEHHQQFEIVTFTKGLDFLTDLTKLYDIIFLDIAMPVINGLEVASKIREKDPKVAIIFLTNLAALALNGYKVNAVDFLVKPLSYDLLSQTMDRVIDKMAENKEKRIAIRYNHGFKALDAATITYVEVRGHSLVFHCTDGDYETHGALKKVEESLNPKQFVRCNYCFLVNLEFVDSVQENDAIVHGAKLPISRTKKQGFLDRFLDYVS